MNAFTNAIRKNANVAKTGNGGLTNASTGNKVLDFFAAAGNRNVVLNKEFDFAYKTDPKLAYRVLLWTRDIRGGAGERQTFRNVLAHLERNYREDLLLLLHKIPELGRWDDLLVFNDETVKVHAYGIIREALNDRNGLAAKWMPRKGPIAVELTRFLGYTPKQYRKTLVGLTRVVESQMCAKEWDKIVFDHVPSVASARYQKAFYKRCGDSYAAYKAGLVRTKADGTPERKINASAVFPYDVVKSIEHGDRAVATAQWNALPNFLGENGILPVVDCSESMRSWNYYSYQNKNGKAPTVTPQQIALSIGLYCADKQTGAFKDAIMSFSSSPTLQILEGDIVDKLNGIKRSKWGYDTNVQATFQELLRVARANRVPQEDMPKVLLFLSDMEFNNSCIRGTEMTAFKAARVMFEEAGYSLPQVVFWNINGRSDNNPVTAHDTGAALVSGFSPAIFKSVLKSDFERYTPEAVMLETINNSRYDVPGLTI